MKKEFEKRVYSSLIIIPISLFFVIQGSVFFVFFLSLFLIAASLEWLKMSKKNLQLKFLGSFFLFFSFYSTFYIRENSGLDFFILIVLICIFTDIGGYVFGNLFKGPKLTKISPNKTYSGVVGGFLFALVAGLSHIKYMQDKALEIESFEVLISILIISLISQIGDLIISFFKRKAKLKDSGKIFPGHGGILDRIDGLIFVMPIVYIYKFIL
tara:strand:- start:6013 stop:6648 length:636 start_codon:yes stop_codon:yes gene_type:complete